MPPSAAMRQSEREPATEFADQSDLEALSVLANYRDWIISRFAPYLRGRIVEYGAGIGSISASLVPYAEGIDLVEPFDMLFTKLSAQFDGVARVRLYQQTIAEHANSAADASYDAAVMVNVLEHIEDDCGALVELHRILLPGGTLCLFVPAHQFLYSAYDRLVGHHRRYELPELRTRVCDAGFEITHARYFDILGVPPWLLTMRLLKRTRISSGLALLYDRTAVPVGRTLESLIAPPFGKNVLLIATKPKS
ncbi:MAG: methyltransferase domain-containing protein [Haliea sp.]